MCNDARVSIEHSRGAVCKRNNLEYQRQAERMLQGPAPGAGAAAAPAAAPALAAVPAAPAAFLQDRQIDVDSGDSELKENMAEFCIAGMDIAAEGNQNAFPALATFSGIPKNRKIGLFGVRIHPFWPQIRPGQAHDLPNLNFMLPGQKKLKNNEKQATKKIQKFSNISKLR